MRICRRCQEHREPSKSVSSVCRPCWDELRAKRLRAYGVMIGAALRDFDFDLVSGVEAYMRLEYGTLDHLSKQRFDGLARSCAKAVRLNPAVAKELAASYGLP